MGQFLEVLLLKGSTVPDFMQTLPALVEEHPEMNLGSGSYHYCNYPDVTGILCHDRVVGYEPLAKALSEKLGRSVMLLYIYDGDQWGYYLYDKGRRLDAFNPVPDYFTDDESQTEQCKGNAEIVARLFGVSPKALRPYLVRWTEELMERGGKAFAQDQFAYGDCWQMADFMNALNCPYDALVPQEEPTAAESPPPAVEKPFDTALITNDLERWIADVYVIWSGRDGGNWQLFGGYPKSDENAALLRESLAINWNIKDLTDGINTVNLLVADQTHQTPATDGWDFCRGMQLLGVFYLVGFIDRAQMTEYSCTVGEIIQRHFKSWEQLCESYLAGHALWCRRTFGSEEAEQDVAERRALYEKFKKMKDGPYRLPWKMALTKPTATKETGSAAQEAQTNYFQQWLAAEEQWIGVYRRRSLKTMLLVGLAVMIFTAGFLIGIDQLLYNGETGMLQSAKKGLLAGLVILVPLCGYVMYRLGNGRISQAIRNAVKTLELDQREQEELGREMLEAIQTGSRHLDYQDKAPNSVKTPARLLVGKNYFYQTGVRMTVVLICRSEVEYIEAGQERKYRRVSDRRPQSFILYAVYFYYRSSREQRLEGGKNADNGMGFFDPEVRNRAFEMMDGQLNSY